MKKINLFVFIITLIALVSFDVYKAAKASFTWDESYTYLNYVHQSFIDILTYGNTYQANNHILNTLLMKISEILFGSSELVLRLPNILAHILYLVFTYKLFTHFSTKFFIPFFFIINANPYLIDFFSLARGYGLAIGLTTTGLYYYCRYLENQKNIYHLLSLSFIGLASIANFTLLNVFLILIFIHNVFHIIVDRQKITLKNLFQTNLINLIISIFFCLILYGPIKKLIGEKMIFVGGTNGFWHDTVISLLQTFSYYASYENSIMFLFKIFIIVFSSYFLFWFIFHLVKKKSFSLTRKIVLLFGLLTFLIVIGSIIQFKLLKTPFVMTRFALFIYPIFISLCCMLIAETWDNGFRRIIKVTSFGLLLLFTVIFSFHSLLSLNTNWYYEWRYMSVVDTKKMLMDINDDRAKDLQTISLGSSWIYEPVLNFYWKTLNLKWLNEVYSRGILSDCDYLLVNQSDMNRIMPSKVKLLHYYPITKNCLIKNLNIRNDSLKQTVFIKAANGKFVCSDFDKNNMIIANRDHHETFETFTLFKFDDKKCAICSFNFYYLSAELNNQNEISANRENIDVWETFTIIEIDSNHVAFLAANNKYLCLDEKSLRLFASSNSIGKWENFELIKKPKI